MDVGILVDNPKRDLWGSLLICAELGRRGHKAFLIPMYMRDFDVPLIRMDAIIVNFARLNSLEFFQTCKDKLKTKIYVLDTESGLVSPEVANRSVDGWGHFLQQTGLSSYIDGIFCWGELLRDGLARTSGINPKRLHATGNPRFDLGHYKWYQLISTRAQDYILINANFSNINPKFGTSRENEEKEGVKAGYELEYLRKLFDVISKIHVEFTATIKEAAEKFPEQKFLFRPHPFEDEAYYYKAFAGLKNVTVSCQGEIFDAINRAQMVVHLNCNTAVESLMLDKVPVSLEFLNDPLYYREAPLPSDISLKAHSKEEFFHFLASVANIDEFYQENKVAIYERYIKPCFGEHDGRRAERICDILEHDYEAYDFQKSALSLSSSLKGCKSQPNMKNLLRGLAVNTLGSLQTEEWDCKLRSKRLAKRIYADDIAERLSKIASIHAPELRMQAHYCRHPLTGHKLGSICCAAHSDTASTRVDFKSAEVLPPCKSANML